MRKIHRLKLHENYYNSVMCGEKNFEIRNNDRGFQKGDQVMFLEVEGPGVRNHTKPSPLFEITYVFSGHGIKEGFVVFGIKELE